MKQCLSPVGQVRHTLAQGGKPFCFQPLFLFLQAVLIVVMAKHFIGFHVTTEDYALMRTVARLTGKDLSKWIRENLHRAATTELERLSKDAP